MNITSIAKSVNARYFPKHLLYSPEWLVLGVNNVCNLHCKMCDVGLGNNDTVFAQNLVGTSPLNMPLELLSKIIEECAQTMPNVKLGYAFTEPLVYPHLIPSIELASMHGLFTSITTNALTLPQKAEKLANAGLREIYISLDGLEKTHNFIRGNEKSFQKAVEGIEKLLTFEKRPSISIFSVITEWNIGEMTEFVKFFKDFPLKEIGFMHTNFTPDWLAVEHNKHYGEKYAATLSNTGEIDLDKMDLKQLWSEIQNIKKLNVAFPVSFSPEVDSYEDLKVFYHKPEQKWGKRCNDAFRNIMIKSDGSVIPSHGRCYNLTLGNVNESSLSAIWNSKVAGEFRSTLNNAGGLLPACNRCCSAF
ncbi:MAG: radical SAM protein [Salibacteraceae bacterium]|nr:radical SAM protein [Salibacteraceae bacterium]